MSFRRESGSGDGELAGGGDVLLVVGGDGGPVEVDAAVYAAACGVGEIPCEGLGESHVGLGILLTGPHGAPHEVEYLDLYVHNNVGTIVRYDEVGVVARRVAVGIEVEYLRSLSGVYREFNLRLSHIVGGVPYAQTQCVGTCCELGHKEVEIARHGAILSGSVIIHGLGIGDIAVELKVNLVADAGCRYIDADVIAYARDYHWCGVDGLSERNPSVLRPKNSITGALLSGSTSDAKP